MLEIVRRWHLTRHQTLGDSARDRKDWLAAESCYRRVLESDPNRADIQVQLGHALKEQSKFQESMDAYRRAIMLAPADPDPYLHLGRMLVDLGHSVEGKRICIDGIGCVEALTDPSKKNDLLRQLRIAVADAARSSRNWTEAKHRYREALDIDSTDARIWVQLGHALKEDHDLRAAERAYRKAIELDPHTVDTYVHLCDLLTVRFQRAEQGARDSSRQLEEALASVASIRNNFEAKLRTTCSSHDNIAAAPNSPPLNSTLPTTLPPASSVEADTQSKSGFRLHDMPKATSRDLFAAIGRAASEGRPIFVSLPTISWDVPLFQRPQHMALAMARQGAFALYFTYEDLKADHRVINEHCWLANPNMELFSRLEHAIITFYSTAPANEPSLLEQLKKRNRIGYEYIDHVDEAISGDYVPQLLRLKEFAFSQGADFIVASSKALEDEAVARVGRDRVVLAQNGVDYDHYRAAMMREDDVPARIAALKSGRKGIVGYFGALAPWIWYEMLNELTAKRPDLGFVFIGPDYYGGMDKIERRSNVLVTGPIPYQQLPIYAKHFDIAIIPFRHGEIARTTSPLKLFEYFALEKPVVVTDQMDECTVYSEVLRASDTDMFSIEVDRALARSQSPSFRERLRELATENTWDARASAMLRFVG